MDTIFTATTQGIKISVKSQFHEKLSRPSLGKFVYKYNVHIENLSGLVVQLLSRHWFIQDAKLKVLEVKGDGVIGLQPILEPGESHNYDSWCPISTPIGKMWGTFNMVRSVDGSEFSVEIPEFRLIADFKLN